MATTGYTFPSYSASYSPLSATITAVGETSYLYDEVDDVYYFTKTTPEGKKRVVPYERKDIVECEKAAPPATKAKTSR